MATLIVTTEESGVDKYSQEIAERLNTKQIFSPRYISLKGFFHLSKLISKENDIVHIPNQNFARFCFLRSKPYIVTVHDIIRFYLHFEPERPIEKLLLYLDIWCIKRANHIIAVSQHTKMDLVEYMGIPENKITVIYNGIDHTIYKPCNGNLRLIDRPYILYVGSERSRKNLGNLIKALAVLKKDFSDLNLLKVGPIGRRDAYHENTQSILSNLGITRDVTFVDYVSEDDLASYYRSAELLVYPSLYEGFGLPPLEAMACGCPVVTSDTSSLPEVVGDAGILVDPHDIDSLTNAIKRVLVDDNLKRDMVTKGLERAQTFSWEKTAQETLQVYRRIEANLGYKYLSRTKERVPEAKTQRDDSSNKSSNVNNGSLLIKR
jgi:glycosyltransferase involved in cell wall biosynthesis